MLRTFFVKTYALHRITTKTPNFLRRGQSSHSEHFLRRGQSSPSIEKAGWLNYYSHVFDYVEIDSSFYRIPNVFAVKNWSKKTPKDFKFTAKFPKVITHDKRLKDTDKELERFFDAMVPKAGV